MLLPNSTFILLSPPFPYGNHVFFFSISVSLFQFCNNPYGKRI